MSWENVKVGLGWLLLVGFGLYYVEPTASEVVLGVARLALFVGPWWAAVRIFRKLFGDKAEDAGVATFGFGILAVLLWQAAGGFQDSWHRIHYAA